ncbi:hypothetical protein ACS0TY_016905 [Phlomoides rotata]
MNHSKSRNVIERTFNLFRKWWAILRSPSFYPINIQNRVILACALIYNLINNKSLNDPLDGNIQSATETQVEDDGFIDSVKPLQAWSTRRDNLAQEIWKSENCFKTCYMNLLSTYMKQILKHTGVGLDSTTKMVEAIEEQWEGFMKSRATGQFAQSYVNARTPPPSFSTVVDVEEGSNRVIDENVGESESPTGYVQTGECREMGKISSGRK